MKTDYERPEVKFIGTAEEIVRGSYGTGADLTDQRYPQGMEFASDEELPAA